MDADEAAALRAAEGQLPFAKVKEALLRAIEQTVTTAATTVFLEAKERAPVRKVFAGAQRTEGKNVGAGRNRVQRGGWQGAGGIEGLTKAGRELWFKGGSKVVTRRSRIHGADPVSRGFSAEFLRNRRQVMREGGRMNARDVDIGTRGNILGLAHGTHVEPALTSRGRYELSSGRAVYSATGNIDVSASRVGAVTLGGRLKGEIEIYGLEHKGNVIRQEVHSETDYAKYVEFGTRYAAAQPYMRPGLAKARKDFVTNLRRNLLSAGKKTRAPRGFGKETIGSDMPRKSFAQKRSRVSAADINRLESFMRGGYMIEQKK